MGGEDEVEVNDIWKKRKKKKHRMKGVKWVRKRGIQMTGGRVEEKKIRRGGV